MVVQDLYETEFNIYNHLHINKKPLSSVSMHPGEDINDGSLLEEVIRNYSLKRIYDTFHISLLEFLELPMDIVQILYTISNEENSRKNAELSKIQEDFDK